MALGSAYLDDLYARGVIPSRAQCTCFAPAPTGTPTIKMSPWLEAALIRAGAQRVPASIWGGFQVRNMRYFDEII